MSLGKIGIWQHESLLTGEVAAELEELGYGAIWIGGSPDGRLDIVERLLDATKTIAVATGIVNMWKDDAATVAASYHRIAAKHPGRFLLGVGIGHPEHTQVYQKPYDKVVSYLDELDEAGVPAEERVLAALGPKVLKLSGERARGAHPYLTVPSHTKEAREILGPDKLLAPEQKVVLDTDPDRARAVGRSVVEMYLGLDNYVRNLKRSGYTDEDVAKPGSDRLVDALALHGDAATIARGLNAHLEAGADHITVQASGSDPLRTYRELAKVLF